MAKRIAVTYTRNGNAGKTGDPRFSKPTGRAVDTSGPRPVLVLPDENGIDVRWPLPRNVYVPDADEAESVTIPFSVPTITMADASAGGGAAAAVPESMAIEARLVAEGDVENLALYYQEHFDGVGPKLGRSMAERKIADAN